MKPVHPAQQEFQKMNQNPAIGGVFDESLPFAYNWTSEPPLPGSGPREGEP